MSLGYQIDEWCQVGWVISSAMCHSTAIRSVIYIGKDSIKIELQRSIRCPVALLFPLAMREARLLCCSHKMYKIELFICIFIRSIHKASYCNLLHKRPLVHTDKIYSKLVLWYMSI